MNISYNYKQLNKEMMHKYPNILFIYEDNKEYTGEFAYDFNRDIPNGYGISVNDNSISEKDSDLILSSLRYLYSMADKANTEIVFPYESLGLKSLMPLRAPNLFYKMNQIIDTHFFKLNPSKKRISFMVPDVENLEEVMEAVLEEYMEAGNEKASKILFPLYQNNSLNTYMKSIKEDLEFPIYPHKYTHSDMTNYYLDLALKSDECIFISSMMNEELTNIKAQLEDPMFNNSVNVITVEV
jgi:hypothetical protein